MAAPSLEPAQPALPQPRPPAQPRSARKGKMDLGKLAMGLALVFSTVAALIAGIVIGSAARKRIHRLAHPYP